MKLKKIGTFESCFKELFGIPRQSSLAPSVQGKIILSPPFDRKEMISDLDKFSHIWVIFGFHAIKNNHFRTTVRPPRLGGNKKVGVFATRSPYRPNPIGISLLKIIKVQKKEKEISILVSGQDILDQTPVYDIKPYLPSVDCEPKANGGWTDEVPINNEPSIQFSTESIQNIQKFFPEKEKQLSFQKIIKETLALDPRPGHQRGQMEYKTYGFRLLDFDILWSTENNNFSVEKVFKIGSNNL
ncbi:MAG: tRNA (N6-threonylcarbamoyladenosine(37)-N6)-methyltransferase TrmO [Halobacteriovoraceae bacterium]|nr:tRNA (N6-threonylcarbamoyladenosine(37)-N6)-methyltransferase TrmO [Halobacteriovoraceae bacterium]